MQHRLVDYFDNMFFTQTQPHKQLKKYMINKMSNYYMNTKNQIKNLLDIE